MKDPLESRTISRFDPSDIDFRPIYLFHPQEHKTYLESRTYASTAIHDSHLINLNSDADGTSKRNPVAWSIVRADGLLEVLRVEPSHRGLRLGDLILDERMSQLEVCHGFSRKRVTGAGILGWRRTDASPVNVRSMLFFFRGRRWGTR